MKTNTNNLSLISLFSLLCFILFPLFCSALEPRDGNVEFSYDEETGRGPSRWAQLDPNWFLCGNGTRQSPIAIYDFIVRLKLDLGKLITTYKPAPATLINQGSEIEVSWRNGDAGNIIINGTSYKLLEFHWHTPSEHKINGIRYAMELHIVHQSDIGQIAVVGILYRYGLPDPFISRIYRSIRSLRNGTRSVNLGILDPREVFDNYGSINDKYYRYNGSLTTPPCTENVIWTILQKVQTVSPRQVQALKEAVDEGFEENARPIQPLNGREVYKYHPCIY